MVRLVLFDIDGTLIQSGGAGEKAFARVCEAEFGVPEGTAQLQFAGRTDPSIIRDFFQHHRIDPSKENFARFLDRYVFFLDHFLRQLAGCVLPGVHQWLQEVETLSHRPLLGLLTGNIRLGAELKLTHYGLWKHFQMGAFGDDHEDRNWVAAVARERGSQLLQQKLTGPEILVIGDTPRDIECAQAIEARCLAVATGKYSEAELAQGKATWVVKNLEHLSADDACK